MELTGSERILVLKPSSLGDIVHTLPAVAAIKRAFPNTRIDWLANTEWTPILEGSPVLERVIPFPRRDLRGISGLWKGRKWAAEALRKTNYDLALDFQGLLRTALFAKISRAKRIIGFEQAREGAHLLYADSICIEDWQKNHAIDRNREIPHFLGIETLPIECPLPKGNSPDGELELETPALLLHPFSRGQGKSLSAEETAELCTSLAPLPIWLVGRCDPETAEKDWPENVTNFLNRTSLTELIWLIRRAAWSVSVDSGPMHLAAGISDRILSIHTWSDPLMVGPYRENSWVWRDGQIRQVSSISQGEFPEDRQARKRFETQKRMLTAKQISQLAEFLHSQIHS